jgi:hypothetical protein
MPSLVQYALTAVVFLAGLSTTGNVARAVPVNFQLTLNQTFPDIETVAGTFSIDSGLLTPNTFISFDFFLSFSMPVDGIHWTLSDALNPSTEGVRTDASGAVVRFEDVALTIFTEFCRSGCAQFLRFQDNTFIYDTLGGASGDSTTGTYSISVVSNGSEIPLPAALPLFATGLGLMGLLAWRRKMPRAGRVRAA